MKKTMDPVRNHPDGNSGSQAARPSQPVPGQRAVGSTLRSAFEGNKYPRGAIKAFREYLNAKFAGSKPHRHDAYHQRTRGYGDYLYYQDRDKFNVELSDALGGHESYRDFIFTDSNL